MTLLTLKKKPSVTVLETEAIGTVPVVHVRTCAEKRFS